MSVGIVFYNVHYGYCTTVIACFMQFDFAAPLVAIQVKYQNIGVMYSRLFPPLTLDCAWQDLSALARLERAVNSACWVERASLGPHCRAVWAFASRSLATFSNAAIRRLSLPMPRARFALNARSVGICMDEGVSHRCSIMNEGNLREHRQTHYANSTSPAMAGGDVRQLRRLHCRSHV